MQGKRMLPNSIKVAPIHCRGRRRIHFSISPHSKPVYKTGCRQIMTKAILAALAMSISSVTVVSNSQPDHIDLLIR